MKKVFLLLHFCLLLFLISCQQKNTLPSPATINNIHLKTGELVSCGPLKEKFGTVDFKTTCSDAVQNDFILAVKLLPSFEYDEAEKAFAKVISQQPDCAMAYWGVAMFNFHPLWTPPTEAELIKGSQALQIAKSLKTSTREALYIDAIGAFYTDWKNKDHISRCRDFEKRWRLFTRNFPTIKRRLYFMRWHWMLQLTQLINLLPNSKKQVLF